MNDGRDSLRAWLALLSAANRIKKSVDARMRQQFSLSLSRFDVLAALDRAGEPGLTAGALSSYLKVTDGNTTQVTAPLIAAGLVRRTVSANDRRMAILQLTRKGQRIFAEMAAANREWIADVFAVLTPAQIAGLRRTLRQLNHPQEQSAEEAA
jgi:DNA-binding MarR family transcriptional regulator